MSRAAKLLTRLSLLAVLLLSFGATGYMPTLDGDGDENIGMSAVVSQQGSTTEQRSSEVSPQLPISASAIAYTCGQSNATPLMVPSAGLAMPASAQSIIPLRT
jgi:hypothetical protein